MQCQEAKVTCLGGGFSREAYEELAVPGWELIGGGQLEELH